MSGSSGADKSNEIDALLEGLFTVRSAQSTSRSGYDDGLETQRPHPSDNALAKKLSALGAAVDHAYADYISQQQGFDSTLRGEALTETWRTQPDDTADDQLDIGSELELLYDDDDENRVVQFDVGGRIFRCKASVINQYPGARLHEILTSGRDRFADSDTFFIDRSARNFEVILDWYRTGKVSQPAGINRAALEQDARYFRVFNEMFKGDSTSNSQHLTTSVDATQQQFRFARREQHCLVPNTLPLVHRVRSHEQLVVASVKGHGKLMVRVCDPTGMQTVHVDQAVLYDSKAQFFLDGARAHLPVNALLPGDFVYTFWVEQDPKSDHKTPLDLELQLLSTYSEQDLVPSAAVLQPLQSERSPLPSQATPDLLNSSRTLSPVLFLPPFMQAIYQREDGGGDDLINILSTATRRRITGASNATVGIRSPKSATKSPKPKINFVARAAAVPRVARSPIRTNQTLDIPSSPIRRTGATIATRGMNESKMDGKVTVFRPDKLSFVKGV